MFLCHVSSISVAELTVYATADVPAASAGKLHPALEKCKVHGMSGSSYVVTCTICGLGGEKGLTTSLHKLTYGHFLHAKGTDINPCVSRDVLSNTHSEWFAKLTSREDKLHLKRRYTADPFFCLLTGGVSQHEGNRHRDRSKARTWCRQRQSRTQQKLGHGCCSR
jgi:hypothetical protein